jgi:hypothetical protein
MDRKRSIDRPQFNRYLLVYGEIKLKAPIEDEFAIPSGNSNLAGDRHGIRRRFMARTSFTYAFKQAGQSVMCS